MITIIYDCFKNNQQDFFLHYHLVMNKTGEDQGCDVYPHPEKQIKMHNIRKNT